MLDHLIVLELQQDKAVADLKKDRSKGTATPPTGWLGGSTGSNRNTEQSWAQLSSDERHTVHVDWLRKISWSDLSVTTTHPKR